MGRSRCITHPSATRHPQYCYCCAAVRLACVRHAASVQSEPGSNSSLKFSMIRRPSIFLKGLSQRKTSLLTLCWTLALLWTVIPSTARRPHKSPAHTVKDLYHLLHVAVSALEHFVPSEPLILHRFSCPSTPSARNFLLSLLRWKTLPAAGGE